MSYLTQILYQLTHWPLRDLATLLILLFSITSGLICYLMRHISLVAITETTILVLYLLSEVTAIDPAHKSHNASDIYPTIPPPMQHFVTEMCTHVHISVAKCCIVGYGTGALWDWCNKSVDSKMEHPSISRGNLWVPTHVKKKGGAAKLRGELTANSPWCSGEVANSPRCSGEVKWNSGEWAAK